MEDEFKICPWVASRVVDRGSTFALRRSTLDFCLGGQPRFASFLKERIPIPHGSEYFHGSSMLHSQISGNESCYTNAFNEIYC